MERRKNNDFDENVELSVQLYIQSCFRFYPTFRRISLYKNSNTEFRRSYIYALMDKLVSL